MLALKRRQLLQPVNAARRRDEHVEDEDRFKEQEEETAQDLSSGNIAKAHEDIGDLGLPVTVDEGGDKVFQFAADPQEQILEEAADGNPDIGKPAGNRREEAFQVVQNLLSP